MCKTMSPKPTVLKTKFFNLYTNFDLSELAPDDSNQSIA